MVTSGVDSADDSITEFMVLALITSAQKSHRTGINHLCSGSQNQLTLQTVLHPISHALYHVRYDASTYLFATSELSSFHKILHWNTSAEPYNKVVDNGTELNQVFDSTCTYQ